MRHIIFALPAAVLICACTGPNAPIATIPVDVDSATRLTIDTTRLLPLQTSDSSMLYDINSLELCGNRFIVHSRNYLRAFDINSGRFLGNVAHQGKGENNFSYIGNLWLDNDTVRFFDTNVRAIYSFSPDGVFYGRNYPFGTDFSIEDTPRQYFKVPDVGVFTTNLSNDHSASQNPRYSFYKPGHKKGTAVPGREITEPTFLADGTFTDTENKRLLSWEPLRDTIFEVTTDAVRPLYHIDFGDKALPEEVQALPYGIERIKIFNSKTSDPYASLIRYVQPHKGNIYFTFAYGDENNLTACYNEQSGRTSVCHIASADNKFSQTTFFKITGDSAYVEVRKRDDIFSNPFLYKIALSDLQ